MDPPTKIKYKRNTKIHTRQYKIFLDAMDLHPELRNRPTSDPQYRRLWKQLSVDLNSLGVGPIKTPERWSDALRHWKNKTKSKVRSIQKQAQAIGGGPANMRKLTPFEERLLIAFGEQATTVPPDDGPRRRAGDPLTRSSSSLEMENSDYEFLDENSSSTQFSMPSSSSSLAVPTRTPTSHSVSMISPPSPPPSTSSSVDVPQTTPGRQAATTQPSKASNENERLTAYQRERLEVGMAQADAMRMNSEALELQADAISNLAKAVVASNDIMKGLFAKMIEQFTASNR